MDIKEAKKQLDIMERCEKSLDDDKKNAEAIALYERTAAQKFIDALSGNTDSKTAPYDHMTELKK